MAHKIEWTEQTWNPSAGCTKISSGCQNCYAETMAIRLQAMGVEGYENGFKFNIVPSRLNDPLKKKKPTVFFVNSMSDIFHKDMPENYLDKIFDIIDVLDFRYLNLNLEKKSEPTFSLELENFLIEKRNLADAL